VTQPGTAEQVLDTAAELPEAPPEDLLPETEVAEAPAPETEAEPPSPETAPSLEDDPRVAALIKSEKAKIEESYRRRVENAQRQAQIEEYERAREAAFNQRAQSAMADVSAMLKEAFEDGKEPDLKKLEGIITGTNSAGIIETMESMEGWINTFLKEDNPTFFRQVADEEELNRLWVDAKTSRRPDRVMAAALKIAAASGEAKGFSKGQQAVLNAMKTRETEAKKTAQDWAFQL